MKGTKRFFAFLLALVLCVTLIPFAAFAYGSADKKLIITHINEPPSREGTAVIASGALHKKLGSLGTFAWWKVIIFDWDADEKVYKVVSVYQNSNNQDKSTVEIPETGFAYGICIGNDYSASGGINYRTQKVMDSCNYITTSNIPAGTKAYLYNTDLANAVMQDNGKLWHDAAYESYSYIKLETPDEGKTAYDPNEVMLLGFDIVPTDINSINYQTQKSIILTDDTGYYTTQPSGKYEWWTTVVFEWNDFSEYQPSYVVSSVSRTLGNNAPKQPIIPANGFALLDCGANTSATGNLREGTVCWLYDIDLEKGTFGASPKIRANIPLEGVSAYDPQITPPRLTTPDINEKDRAGNVNTLESGITVTWDAISGADGYRVAINDASINPDGPLKVLPVTVPTNEYTVPADILAVGGSYTLWISAFGEGYTDSFCEKATIKCVSESALNTSLKDKTIVAFGDSLTERTGYVNMLYGYLGNQVINAGIGGNTTIHAKSRFDVDVIDQNPDVVIICFGMNDQATVISTKKPNVSLETYTQNLREFASTLTQKGVDVIFMTPNPAYDATGYYKPGEYGLDYAGEYMDDFCNAMREVALEFGCGLVDINYECDFEDMSKFMAFGDGIHQSTEGHLRYAELISDYLFAAYDDVDKATMTVTAKDEDGNVLGTYTHVGKTGAHITLATPVIEGKVTADADIKTTFVDGAAFEFVYEDENLVPKTESGYTVNEEKGYVLGVKESTKAGDFNKSFATEITVCGKDGKQLSSTDMVGNGCTVAFGGKTYTVIVKGDINGNGNIDSTDYLMLKRAILGTYKLDEIGTVAGAVSDGVAPAAADYIKLKRHVLGTFDIFD